MEEGDDPTESPKAQEPFVWIPLKAGVRLKPKYRFGEVMAKVCI
jgi:hypothetical protein